MAVVATRRLSRSAVQASRPEPIRHLTIRLPARFSTVKPCFSKAALASGAAQIGQEGCGIQVRRRFRQADRVDDGRVRIIRGMCRRS